MGRAEGSRTFSNIVQSRSLTQSQSTYLTFGVFIFNFELLYSSNWRGGCLAVEELQGGGGGFFVAVIFTCLCLEGRRTITCPNNFALSAAFSISPAGEVSIPYCTEYSYLSTLTKHAFPLSSSRIRTIIPNTYTDHSLSLSLYSLLSSTHLNCISLQAQAFSSHHS